MRHNGSRKPQWTEQVETAVLVLILLVVGAFSGAATFTHVHDWTMAHTPEGRGDWFGWVNAVISELVPIASLLVMRRRRRTGQSVAYPAFLLVLALALSITAQLAVAKPGVSGAVVSVVPALAFAALAKLVLGKAPVVQGDSSAVEHRPLPVRYQEPSPDRHNPVADVRTAENAVMPTVTAVPVADGNHDGRPIGRLTR